MTTTLLRSAIRRARQAGLSWAEVYRVAATEYGACMRESHVDGWKPMVKEETKGKGKRCK